MTTRTAQCLFAVLGQLVLVGCAATSDDSKLGAIVEPAMQICIGEEAPETVRPDVIYNALVQAAAWANQVYGEDCAVCAEFLQVSDRQMTIHITGPTGEEFYISTSATMTFDTDRAVILERHIHHSCWAREIS